MSLPPDQVPDTPVEPKRPGGEMRSAANSSSPTRSQLLPFGSEWQELLGKSYFMPGVIGALAVTLLFMFMSDKSASIRVMYGGAIPVDVPLFTVVMALFISLGGAFAIYRMAGTPKAWWLMPAVGVFTAFLCLSPVMSGLQGIFAIANPSTQGGESVAVSFVKMFFLAGLPEETLKSIPVFFGLFAGLKLTQTWKASTPARQVSVTEPLDGIVIGAASGFGFAFAETLFMYVPRQILVSQDTVNGLLETLRLLGTSLSVPKDMSTPEAIVQLFVRLAQRIGLERATFELQQILRARQSAGLELMIPRLLSEIFGHAAYAGVFGYFIGLAALKPVSRVKTVLIGLALASALHATWNSMASSTFVMFLCALLGFVMLAICINKARRLSPDRSRLMPSQIIDRFTTSDASGAKQATPATPATTAFQPTRPTPATPPEARKPMQKPTVAQPPLSMTWQDESNLRTIEVGSARVPASVGVRLYETQVSGARAQRGDGVIAEVGSNPADPAVLGLKNLSNHTWAVAAASGAERVVEPGRSIRLEAGMTIRIGAVVAHVR